MRAWLWDISLVSGVMAVDICGWGSGRFRIGMIGMIE